MKEKDKMILRDDLTGIRPQIILARHSEYSKEKGSPEIGHLTDNGKNLTREKYESTLLPMVEEAKLQGKSIEVLLGCSDTHWYDNPEWGARAIETASVVFDVVQSLQDQGYDIRVVDAPENCGVEKINPDYYIKHAPKDPNDKTYEEERDAASVDDLEKLKQAGKSQIMLLPNLRESPNIVYARSIKSRVTEQMEKKGDTQSFILKSAEFGNSIQNINPEALSKQQLANKVQETIEQVSEVVKQLSDESKVCIAILVAHEEPIKAYTNVFGERELSDPDYKKFGFNEGVVIDVEENEKVLEKGVRANEVAPEPKFHYKETRTQEEIDQEISKGMEQIFGSSEPNADGDHEKSKNLKENDFSF